MARRAAQWKEPDAGKIEGREKGDRDEGVEHHNQWTWQLSTALGDGVRDKEAVCSPWG